jgi:exopolysaccharide biosynthesis polyprenyl glycosylphosphotransferase
MSNRAKTNLLIFLDLIILFLASMAVSSMHEAGSPHSGNLQKNLLIISMIYPFWMLIFFIEGLYTLKTFQRENLPTSLVRATSLAMILSLILMSAFPSRIGTFSPKTDLLLIGLSVMGMMYGVRRAFFAFFSQEHLLKKTFLVGSLETLELVKKEADAKPYLGYKIVGLSVGGLDDVKLDPSIELIAIERNITKHSHLYRQIFSRLGSGIEVMDMATLAEKVSGKIPIEAIDESWFIEYCGHHESRSYDMIKNIIDRTIASLLLVALLPLALILIPLLLIFHGRPIFFKQVRTGLNNKPFVLYKLRTMVIDAEKNGAQWAKPGDARITPLGKFLRKTRIDELPQLINILKGEMSLVGPRPERPEIIEKQLAPSIPYYNLRHLVKPGVTGWAQVTFRYGFSKEDSKEKLQYDLFYAKNRDGWLDLLVFIKTIKTVLTGAGQ